MSESEQAWISILFGVICVLIGIGLALAKIDPDELRKKSHTIPDWLSTGSLPIGGA